MAESGPHPLLCKSCEYRKSRDTQTLHLSGRCECEPAHIEMLPDAAACFFAAPSGQIASSSLLFECEFLHTGIIHTAS
jgi:hypothetical protein